LIDDLVDNTYLGLLELVLPDRDEPILVDSRPSDGLALAVRSGATIHVAPKVLDASRERHFEGLESDQVATALSITVVAIDDDIRASLRLPERPGVIVNQARGPALDAGISAGMMIL